MGGRGSASGASGGGKKQAKKSPLDKLLSVSAKTRTKGLTKTKLQKMSRGALENLATVLVAKYSMKARNLSARDAFEQASSLVSFQSTSRLINDIWKLRNFD